MEISAFRISRRIIIYERTQFLARPSKFESSRQGCNSIFDLQTRAFSLRFSPAMKYFEGLVYRIGVASGNTLHVEQNVGVGQKFLKIFQVSEIQYHFQLQR